MEFAIMKLVADTHGRLTAAKHFRSGTAFDLSLKSWKKLSLLLSSLGGVVAAYFLIYAVLSLNGSYQVVLSDLNHAEYGWIPYEFYPPRREQPNWINTTLFSLYLPLWQFDEIHIHNNPPPSIYRSETKN